MEKILEKNGGKTSKNGAKNTTNLFSKKEDKKD